MGLAFLITSDRLQLLCERKVLKQTDYAAMLDAAGVVRAAQAEARRLREDAAAEAQQVREAARLAGREEARTEQAAVQLEAALALQRQLEALRESVARLVTRAVTQIVAAAEPRDVFAAALERADALVREERFVAVRVAPAQAPALHEALRTLGGRLGWPLRVAVEADATLPDGACTMQTPSGTLDLGVPAQIDAFVRAFEREQRVPPGGPHGQPAR